MDANVLLRSLRETGKMSDLVVVCGTESFNVHKCVMCMASEWFDKACNNETWKESNEGKIVLECAPSDTDDVDLAFDDPKAVRLLIDFVYLSDYVTPFEQQQKETKAESRLKRFSTARSTGKKMSRNSRWISAVPPVMILKDDQLTTHARMFQMGDKFFVPTLKTAAIARFEKRFGAGNVDPDDLAAAITIAYNTGGGQNNGMQKCVFDCLAESSDRTILNERVRAAIEGVENLAFDLFERVKYGIQSEQNSGQTQDQAETAMTQQLFFDPGPATDD